LFSSLITGLGSILFFAFVMTGSRGGYVVGAIVFLVIIIAQPKYFKLGIVIRFVCSVVPVLLVMKGFNDGVADVDNLEAGKWIMISYLLSVAACFIFSLASDSIGEVMRRKDVRLNWKVYTIFAVTVLGAVIIFRDKMIQFVPPI